MLFCPQGGHTQNHGDRPLVSQHSAVANFFFRAGLLFNDAARTSGVTLVNVVVNVAVNVVVKSVIFGFLFYICSILNSIK